MLPSALLSSIVTSTLTVPWNPCVLLINVWTRGDPSSVMTAEEFMNSKTPDPPSESITVTGTFSLGMARRGVVLTPKN